MIIKKELMIDPYLVEAEGGVEAVEGGGGEEGVSLKMTSGV